MGLFDLGDRQLSADHPHVATSLNNLAALYDAQGRYGEAAPLLTCALAIVSNTEAIRTEKLGHNHPIIQQIRTNLALLYDDMAKSFQLRGRYDKVVTYREKAIQLRQSVE